MISEYVWVVELAIKPGQLDEFRALMREMGAAIQANEPDTINYELFISQDARTCHIFEQYADAPAVMTHLGHFQQRFAQRFAAVVDVTAFTVYGNPNDEVRQVLRGFGAVFMAPLTGFAR